MVSSNIVLDRDLGPPRKGEIWGLGFIAKLLSLLLNFNITVSHKTCHFILDHNSHVSWWIFTLLVPMETGTNTPQRDYKIYNFILTVSTLPDKTKTT